MGTFYQMVDYERLRIEVGARKQNLLTRQIDIPKEKQKLDAEFEANKRELIGLDQILDGLAFMDGSVPLDFEPAGFTDNVRKILSETSVPLVPTQIRDALQAKGIEGSSSKNLLINVHKVLERIDSELEKSTTPEGKTAYKRTQPWVSASSNNLATWVAGLYDPSKSAYAGKGLSDFLERLEQATKNEPLQTILKMYGIESKK